MARVSADTKSSPGMKPLTLEVRTGRPLDLRVDVKGFHRESTDSARLSASTSETQIATHCSLCFCLPCIHDP